MRNSINAKLFALEEETRVKLETFFSHVAARGEIISVLQKSNTNMHLLITVLTIPVQDFFNMRSECFSLHSRWNILDFMIVIFSIAGIILDLVHNSMKVSVKPIVLRSLRVLRIIRGT